MEDVNKDGRFSHVGKDPRFRRMKRTDRKVHIDKRFNAMFQDKSFKLKYTVDKRGRPIQTTSNEHLRRFYELDDSDQSDAESDDNKKNKDKKSKAKIKAKKDVSGAEKLVSKGEMKEKETSSEDNFPPAKRKEGKKLSKKNIKSNVSIKSELNLGKLQQKGKGKGTEVKGTSPGKVASSKKNRKPELENTDGDEEDDEDELNTDDEDEEEEEDEAEEEQDEAESEPEFPDEESEEENNVKPTTSALEKGGPDLARGQGNVTSSSEEDTDDDNDDADDYEESSEELDHGWGELDKGAPEAKEITRRLAACNLDWDRIKATDLMVLFNSFKPQGGIVHSVKIYPSEFGLERMAEEAIHGPPELRGTALTGEADDDEEEGEEDENEETTEGSEYHREKLRQYQLNRLKYYYAVIECDSPATADKIYVECDGMEYETSSTRLDLRFIPDDTTFDREPKSMATDVPDAATYKPTLFVATALNQTKVDCTWDETDQDRVQLLKRDFKKDDIEAMDLKDYLASSSSEDEGQSGGLLGLDSDEEEEKEEEGEVDEEKQINKYRQLLLEMEEDEGNKEDKDMEMEIKFEPGLKDAAETMVKEKLKKKEGQTPWEEYLDRKREKKKKKREEKMMEKVTREATGNRAPEDYSDDDLPIGVDLNDPYFKEEMEKMDQGKTKKKKKKGKKEEMDPLQKQEQEELALLMGDEDDNKNHFNLKTIMENEKNKKKKKKKRMGEEESQKSADNFQINVTDPRFEAVYSSHLFNIDPAAPEFKKTKAMEAVTQEKLKRIKDGGAKQRKRKADITDKAETSTKVAKGESDSVPAKTGGLDPSLSSLVKSLKAKTQTFKSRKEKRMK